jgi:streptogramin lyase
MNRQVVAGLFVTAGLIAGIVPAAPASATAAGEFTTFEQFDGSSAPLAIEKGPDGAMWFTERIASRITSVATRRGTLVTASITGRGAVGSRLTCTGVNNSGWSVSSTSRAWLRNGMVISGAAGRSYVVTTRMPASASRVEWH